LESDQFAEEFGSKAQLILGRTLSQAELGQFYKYLILLQKWQGSQRLIGSSEPSWVIDNLFVDSLLFARVIPMEGLRVADLGSGAGFPGLPLKLVCSTMSLTLIEARRKRASFLSAALRELRLDGVDVVSERAETSMQQLESQFDVVVIRCAGALETVIPVSRRLVRSGGHVLASGPPRQSAIPAVEWITVDRPGGGTRAFAISRVE
jgi:16S rRNA (guanine527-N7)-methyltransferase